MAFLGYGNGSMYAGASGQIVLFRAAALMGYSNPTAGAANTNQPSQSGANQIWVDGFPIIAWNMNMFTVMYPYTFPFDSNVPNAYLPLLSPFAGQLYPVGKN